MGKPQQREEELFALASEKPAAERAAFLDGACHNDPALRERLEKLLASHEQPAGLNPKTAVLHGPTRTVASRNELNDETIGSTIGHYKVLQSIGEGGCGAVYMAEQTEPVRRRVALKVIKLGMDTKGVIARFEAERQALALMDHPNIAKVLDAGSTDTGRPYFVMELVRGIQITDYCDQNKLDTHQRLDLFVQICQAIQHAHQKGIIHRDIKPSNILVTLHDGIPVPKVIDFGIAKATTDQRLTDKTLFTAYEQFIGTPAYMSPEQAEMSGLDIDTRSDIYSLGVLLYELLTGRTPFDGKELLSLGMDAMRRTIREKEPARPSAKLHTLQGEEVMTTARTHGAEMPKLVHLIRGDLDWIVMKCLEKDRTRRYDTANGVAMDIRRHLNHEPVVARPPGKVYEFQKTVRRHKMGFAATAAVIVALSVGMVLAAWQWRTALHERKIAQATELTARQRAYASDMNVAKQALDGDNLGRALRLLNRQRPEPGQDDLRGWEWRYLWQQTRSDALYTVCRKASEICSLAASPDGRWLAVGVFNRRGLSVWDMEKRQETVLAGTDNWVRAAFSPAEPILAAASVAGEQKAVLRLWKTSTWQPIGEFDLDGECAGLAFSKDGQTLVTSTAGGHIELWRMPEGTRLKRYSSEQRFAGPAPTAFAATADLRLAAYGLARKQIRVIDLRDGKMLWTANASKDHITALAFSPDGAMLASAAGFGEKDIRLWEVATGREIGRLNGHGSFVSSLVFWPDGRRLASSSGDQTIRIWDVASRSCLDTLRGHVLEVYRVALLPDGKTLASGSKDGEVCVWDASVSHPRQARFTVPGTCDAWCFESAGSSVLTLQQGRVMRWAGSDFTQSNRVLELGTAGYVSPVFSRDGRFLALGSTNGVIRVWNLQHRTLRCELTDQVGWSAPLAFVPGRDRLFVWSDSHGSVDEWDLVANRKADSWPPPSTASLIAFSRDMRRAGLASTLAISPDATRAIAVGFYGDALSADLSQAGQRGWRNFNLDALEVSGAVCAPDGRLFAISSHLGYARVWDTDTWIEQATLRGYLVGLSSLAFSRDGKRLATGSDAQEALRLWDTASWQDVLTLEGDGSNFLRPAFSPDGRTLGSRNNGGTLHLWRAPSWEEIADADALSPRSPGSSESGQTENNP